MNMQQSFVLNVNDDEASRYMVTRMLERSGFWVREAQERRRSDGDGARRGRAHRARTSTSRTSAAWRSAAR
jgi:CheY-like chemotaxis protein